MSSTGTAAASARGVRVRQTLPPLVLVAGNPNSGKSTLFNALTGASAKVSNYPGVTVSRTSATMRVPDVGDVELVDMPGTYSLSARSRDEQVAVDAVLAGHPGLPMHCSSWPTQRHSPEASTSHTKSSPLEHPSLSSST